MSASKTTPSSGRAVANMPLPAELLEYQQATQGLINLPVPLAARRISLVVGTMVIVSLLIMALMPIDKIVSAPGRVIPTTPTLTIQPLDTAIVRSIDVREGQTVTKGQVLARLDSTFTGSDEKTYAAAAQSYGAEVAREKAELAGKPYDPHVINADTLQQQALYLQRKAALDAQMHEYQQRIDGLKQAVTSAEADLTGYRQRLVVARQVETMRQQLQNLAVGSRLNTLVAKDSVLELTREVASGTAKVASAQSDLAAMRQERDYQLQTWRAQTSSDLTTAGRLLVQAQEELTKAQLRHRLVTMRADRPGVVQWVAKVAVGSVVQGGQQLILLVPDDTKYEIEAQIPGDEIGFVTPGQHVTIKFATLWPTTYGEAKGTVDMISPDSFVSDNGPTTTAAQNATGGLSGSIAGAVPGSSNAALAGYYRTRISIGKTEFRNLPAGFRIMPGLAVTADIEVGTQTIMSYILGKTAPMLNGMHEP